MSTHRSEKLVAAATVFAQLLANALLLGIGSPAPESSSAEAFRALVAFAGTEIGVDLPALVRRHPARGPAEDRKVIGRVFTSACYIDGSLPSLLYLAYKYADEPALGLISNTNVGGENCHRGLALGALLGLRASPASDPIWPDKWTKGLYAATEIEQEANAFARMVADAAFGTQQ
jgi:ADP-ribosylglycohydrolase